MKYVRHDFFGIVLFPEGANHKDVATRLFGDCDGIVSAGLVEDLGAGLQCYGESVTIGVKSSEDDTGLLRAQLGMWRQDEDDP